MNALLSAAQRAFDETEFYSGLYELRPDDDRCTVSKAEDRDKYIPKANLPNPPPHVDLSKYVCVSFRLVSVKLGIKYSVLFS